MNDTSPNNRLLCNTCAKVCGFISFTFLVIMIVLSTKCLMKCFLYFSWQNWNIIVGYAKRYGIVRILLVGWGNLKSFLQKAPSFILQELNLVTILINLRYDVMVVKYGYMQNVTKYPVIILRLSSILIFFWSLFFIKSYKVKTFCRILGQLITIAQIAKLSSILSYQIQKLINLNTGNSWILNLDINSHWIYYQQFIISK